MNDTPRTPGGRFVNPVERRMMFFKGFGDGAKMSALKFPDLDYQEAWIAGKNARDAYLDEVTARENLPEPMILRTQTISTDTPEGRKFAEELNAEFPNLLKSVALTMQSIPLFPPFQEEG